MVSHFLFFRRNKAKKIDMYVPKMAPLEKDMINPIILISNKERDALLCLVLANARAVIKGTDMQ
jgi:hypothetical protein